MGYPTYDEWLAKLPEAERERTLKLVAQFKEFGAHEAEDWARSEIHEDLAQLARFVVLNSLWRDQIDMFTVYTDAWLAMCRSDAGRSLPIYEDGAAALKNIQAAGVAKEDLGKLARWIAYLVTFGVITRIDAGYDPKAKTAPHWKLMEFTPNGEPTGRVVGGLHESLLEFEESRAKAK